MQIDSLIDAQFMLALKICFFVAIFLFYRELPSKKNLT